MKWKTIISPKSVLLVLLLAAAVMAVPVSATITPIFSIPGNTSVVFPSEGISPYSTVDYGPLNIPNSFLNSESTSVLSSSPVATSPYNLVTFTNPISVRSDTVNLPITLYGQSYTAILENVPLDFLADGRNMYVGTIEGLTDSKIELLITETNLISATIYLRDDCIQISPAQNREYTQRTSHPLHVVYSENALPKPSGTSKTDFVESTLSDLEKLSEYYSVLRYDDNAWVTINILLSPDSISYTRFGDWTAEADRLMYALVDSTSNAGVRINFGVQYDVSQRNVLTGHWAKELDPLATAKYVFTESYLNGKGADIAVYLGGYDQYNPNLPDNEANYQGHSGFPWDRERVAWVQMVPDNDNPAQNAYTASLHARSYVFIHEIGHLLGAEHPRENDPISSKFDGVSGKYYVMINSYHGEQMTSLDFGYISTDDIKYWRNIVAAYV